jgi:hypothetical protein
MSELTPSLCSCGHDEKHHHDGTGTWAKGCNQPLAMEVECPCKSFSPSPPYDLEGAARVFLAKRKRRYWSDTALAAEQMASFARERIADAVPKWVRVDERLPENGWYLVMNQESMQVAQMLNGTWYDQADDDFIDAYVWVWMPLPEPYVQQEARKDD